MISIPDYKNLKLSDVLKSMSVEIKKVFIAGNFGNGNIGDEMLLKSVLTDLSNYEYVPTVAVRKRLESYAFNAVVPFSLMGVKEYLFADVFVLGPGGFFGGDPGPFSKAILLVVLLSKLLGKKVVFYGFGVYSNCPDWIKFQVVVSCWLADRVSVRDKPAYDLLKQMHLRKHELILDPVFDLKQSFIFSKKSRLNSVLFSLRYIEDQKARKIFLEQLILGLNSITKKIRLIPVTFYSEPEGLFVGRRHPSDSEMIKLIKQKVINNKIIFEEINGHESIETIFDKYCNAGAVVAMRFHAQVMAMMADLPLLAIGYSPKNEFSKSYSKSTYTAFNNMRADTLVRFIEKYA